MIVPPPYVPEPATGSTLVVESRCIEKFGGRCAWTDLPSPSGYSVGFELLDRGSLGTNLSFVDRRRVTSIQMVRTESIAAEPSPVADRLRELLAILALNKSELAEVLLVSRPTLYAWMEGQGPRSSNAGRVAELFQILDDARVGTSIPLNGLFVKQTLLPLLKSDQLDHEAIRRAIASVRSGANDATRRRVEREEKLRALGFEDSTVEQRKERLGQNIAARSWPKR